MIASLELAPEEQATGALSPFGPNVASSLPTTQSRGVSVDACEFRVSFCAFPLGDPVHSESVHSESVHSESPYETARLENGFAVCQEFPSV